MGIKDCDHVDSKKKKIKKIWAGILVFLFICLTVILIVGAVLQPHKPRFTLQDATIYNFTLTSSTMLTSLFQVTVQARNPNDKIGVYYDHMRSYATYHDQQITLSSSIPPTYQDTKEANIWSPFLQGPQVPIAPYMGLQINQDRSMGSVELAVKIDGRVRFRVGTFVSGSYRLHVNCLAVIPFGNNNGGVIVGNSNAIKYQLVSSCDVSL